MIFPVGAFARTQAKLNQSKSDFQWSIQLGTHKRFLLVHDFSALHTKAKVSASVYPAPTISLRKRSVTLLTANYENETYSRVLTPQLPNFYLIAYQSSARHPHLNIVEAVCNGYFLNQIAWMKDIMTGRWNSNHDIIFQTRFYPCRQGHPLEKVLDCQRINTMYMKHVDKPTKREKLVQWIIGWTMPMNFVSPSSAFSCQKGLNLTAVPVLIT